MEQSDYRNTEPELPEGSPDRGVGGQPLSVPNPWVIPTQKPHPSIWVPGVSSRDAVIWCAECGYSYIGVNLPTDIAKKVCTSDAWRHASPTHNADKPGVMGRRGLNHE